ncbi:uncharacterized protein VNE69_03326 [Vairimorpha necatrix]|uniref:Uncharacterized protein n=1 Tax=Vairimorpha necatrix TaxID=6039 RepID=A0AAX4JB11_9MICR
MLLYFLSAVCSDILGNQLEFEAQTSVISTDKEVYGVGNTITSIRHKLLIKKNIINNGDKQVLNPAINYNLRFHPYKSNELISERVSNVDSTEALDLSINCAKIETKLFSKTNINLKKDFTIEDYPSLLNNLKKYIDKWDSEDHNTDNPSKKLIIKGKDCHKLYRTTKKKLYNWLNNPSIIINDLVSRLVKLILASKIEEEPKKLLICQLKFCDQVMVYVQRLLPFKENRKSLSSELLACYVRITQRLPILFYKLNLLEVFLNFFKLISESNKIKDLAHQEIEDLVESLDYRLYITYNGLENFIETIDSMAKILEKL